MASGANLVTSNVDRPSIFELVASQSLDSTLYPALKKVANYLGTLNPERFRYLVNYYDEIFLILNGSLQNYYLQRNGSSLSESFYGLTRFNLKSKSFGKRDYFLSFVLLVIAPYLFRKLEKRMNSVKEKMQDEFTTNDTKKVIGLYAYRTVKSSYEFAQIIKYISYLSGHSVTHSIPLYLTGIGLRHAAYPTYEAFSIRDIFSGKVQFTSILGSLILRCLEFGGFFLQFLQWYQDSSASQKIIAQLPAPDPPEVDQKANKYSNICPICLQTFAIPTSLSVSGYVFCFKCIKNHLSKHQFCPVTHYPATIDDLVRIYDS